jgi:hypothetical protein
VIGFLGIDIEEAFALIERMIEEYEEKMSHELERVRRCDIFVT